MMTKLPATPDQIVHSKLLNRKQVRCAVCGRYISSFTGLPVILDDKKQIIEFAHPGCCDPAHDQVIAIAVRPLAEQVFRWQQRLEGGA
jgi:hypothetical protein